MSASNLEHAAQLIEQGSLSEAVDALRQLIDHAPIHVTAHVLLAEAYEAVGRTGEALQTWRQAYFLLPNSSKILSGLERTSGVPMPAIPPPLPPPAPKTNFVVESSAEAPASLQEAYTDYETSHGFTDLEDDFPWDDLGTADDFEQQLSHEEEAPPAMDVATWDDLEPSVERMENDLEEAVTHRTTTFTPDVEDLDALIQLLDNVGPIRPDPFDPNAPAPEPTESASSKNRPEDVEIVSETFARIHVAQKRYLEASQIYERLAAQHPDQAEAYLEKAAEFRAKANNDSDAS